MASYDMGNNPPEEADFEQRGNKVVTELLRTVEEEFPWSAAGVLIVRSSRLNPERRSVLVDQGATRDLMFAASMTKPAWMAGALYLAEQNDVDLQFPVIPLTPEQQEEIKNELITELSQPDISIGSAMSLSQMTYLTLGLSANAPLGVLKEWMTTQINEKRTVEERKQLGDVDAADFVQNRIEQILQDSLQREDIRWTMRGSQKASKNGTWNCATLEELLIFSQLVEDGDERLGLSAASIQIMQEAMTHTADNDIDLTAQLQGNPKVEDVGDKSGFWPYLELGDMDGAEDIDNLPKKFGLGSGNRWLMTLGTVGRVTMKSGTRYDIGYFVAFPNNEEADTPFDEVMEKGEKAEFMPLKKRAAQTMSEGLAQLVAA